jgi:TRAP-type uncharacterized transport system substrate-binding protein
LFLFILAVAALQPLSARAQPAPAQAPNAQASKAGDASPSVETGPAATHARVVIPAGHRDAARGSRADRHEPRTALANSGEMTLGLMTGEINGTFVQIGSDISSVVSSPSLRVIPLLGKGSLQNVGDLMNLRGVDLALVAVDAARHAEVKMLYPGLRNRVNYIAKLYDSEIHVLAGPDVHSLADLAGKTINVDIEVSGTAVTAPVLFAAMNIQVKMTHDTPDVGLLKLERGEIAAAMYVIGKPGRLFTKIPPNSGLHFVPVPVSEDLARTYVPATFRHADYPNLIADNEAVETMAVPVLLMCYDWPADSPKYKSLAAFTDLFFSHLSDLQQPPYSPKWRDVNPSANVPGWTRAPYAQQWLDRAGAGAGDLAVAAGPPAGTPEDREFTRWAAGIGLVKLTTTQRAQLFSLWQLRRTQPQH